MAAKEFWGLVRQPQLLLLLLVGPVLIMTAFGLSLDVRDVLRPRVLAVVEPGSEGAELFERFQEEFTDRTQIAGTTGDLESARRRLQQGEVDAVITVPPDPLGTVAEGDRPLWASSTTRSTPSSGPGCPPARTLWSWTSIRA